MENEACPSRTVIITRLSVIEQISRRIDNGVVAELIQHNCSLLPNDSLDDILERARSINEAVVSLRIEDHFLSEEDIENFDEADIPKNEREQIRAALNSARDLAANARFITDPVRRSFIHRISKAEAQLFKEKVGVQAFFAAAYESSRLVKQFGNDAKPIAEAIETARTKTELHIAEHPLLEKEQEPKLISKSEDNQNEK